MNKSPCYKCQERHTNCHSECEKYKEYQAKNKEKRELRKKEFDKEHDGKDFKLTMYQKYLKGKGRGK